MPLGLTEQDIADLVAFVENALYDPNLSRYQPDNLPGDGCLVVDDLCN